MGTLVPTPYDFTSRSKYRSNGGGLQFVSSPLTTRFIETNFLDVAVFAKDEGSPTTFTFTAHFNDGSSLLLWSETTDSVDLGFTLPKTVYELSATKRLVSLDLRANRNDHYFVLWSGGGYILAADYRRPFVRVTPNILNRAYSATDTPFLLNEVAIINDIPDNQTGRIEWFVSSSPAITDVIPGLELVNTTAYSATLRMVSPISYDGFIHIGARSQGGLLHQATLRLRIASDPVIINPGNVIASMNDADFSLPLQLLYQGSDPLSWSIQPVRQGLTIERSLGTVRFTRNNYINETIIVTASNIVNRSSTITTEMHVAQSPVITGPPSINHTFNTDNPSDFVFSGLSQVAQGVGPVLTWSIEGADAFPDVSIGSDGIVTFRYGCYVKQTMTFLVENIVGGRASFSTSVHVATTPIVINPGTITSSMNGFDFTYQMQHVTPGNPPISWSVTQIFGLSIDSSLGLLRVKSGVRIDQQITVTATNEVGGSSAVTFDLKVADAPVLKNPGPKRYTLGTEDITFQIEQMAQAPGPLTWTITNAGPSANINDLGIVTISFDSQFIGIVTVTAANNYGASASVSFILDFTQKPIIANPGILSATMYEDDFAYQMTTITQNQPTTWWITDVDLLSGLSINSSTGLLQFENGNYINTDVTVNASNIRGDASNVTFRMHIAQAAAFVAPSVLIANLDEFTPFSYQFSQTAIGTGVVTWNVTDTSGSPIDGVDIDSQGLLSYEPYQAIDRQIIVKARNAVGNFTTALLRLTLEKVPVISRPDNITYSMNQENYVVALGLNDVPTATWRVQPELANVAINPSTGALTFASGTFVYETLQVSASNRTGGIDSETIFANVAETPILAMPNSIKQNTTDGNAFTYTIEQQAQGTGPLQWSLSPNVAGVTLDATGVVSVAPGTYVNSAMTVSTQNRALGRASKAFELIVANNPVIVNPGALVINVARGSSSSYKFAQTAMGTGPLSWNLETTTAVPGLVLQNDTLSATPTSYIDSVVTVRASNILEGISEATLSIKAAEIPFFEVPSILSNSMTQVGFEYPITQLASGTGDILWSLENADTDTFITIDNGVLKVPLYCNVDRSVVVVASNETRVSEGSYRQNVHLNVAQEPEIIPHAPVLSNFDPVNGQIHINLDFPQMAIGTGDLTWKVTGPNDQPIQYLQFASQSKETARISYMSNVIDTTIFVTATNKPGGSNTVSIPFKIARTPIIKNPGLLLINGEYNTDVTYQMEIIEPYASGSSNWSIHSIVGSSLSNLTIDSNSGLITLKKNEIMDADVLVATSNITGGSCNVQFRMIVEQSPFVPNPIEIKSSSNENERHYFQMGQLAPNAGPLVWKVGDENMVSVQFVEISQSGVLDIVPDTYIESNIRVEASNITAGGGRYVTDPFVVRVARNPIIHPVADITSNLPTSDHFTISLSNTVPFAQGGPTSWHVTQHPGLSINRTTGVLTLDTNNSINATVTVTASNVGGGWDREQFALKITQSPIVQNPGRRALSRQLDYTLPVQQVVPRANPVTWSISPTLPGLSINSSSGIITVLSGFSVRESVTVTASNMLGESSSATFELDVLQNPNIVPVPAISNVMAPNTPFNFPLSVMHPTAVGALVWSLEGTPPSGVSIGAADGIVRILPNSVIDNLPITVAVQNQYSNKSTLNIPVRVTPKSLVTSTNASVVSSNIVQIGFQTLYAEQVIVQETTTGGAVSSSTSPVTFGGLTPNTQYQFRVTPYTFLADATGDPVTTNTVTTLPSTPSFLSVLRFSSNEASLAWGSYIGRGAVLSLNNDPRPEISSTTLSNTVPLLPNKSYSFTLTPYNNVGTPGVPISTASITTLPLLSSAYVQDVTSSNVTVAWEPLATENTYSNIQMTWMQDTKVITSNLTNVSSFTVERLPENTPFNFTLTPFNTSNVPGESRQVSTSTRSTLSMLSVSSTPNGITLSWERGSYSYVIVQWSGTSTGSQQVTGTVASIVIQGDDDEDITFVVTAYNRSGEAGASRSVRLVKRDDVLIWFDLQ